MNSKRSYLDALNAGRPRKPHASLEQLNRSLETLEQRIDRNREEVADYSRAGQRRPASQAHSQLESGTRAPARPRAPEYRGAFDQPYQSIARDIERVRSQEDGVAAFGKIAGEIKGLREELRHQMTAGVRREFENLRKDIDSVYAGGSGKALGKLGLDVERLSGAVQSLAEKSDDRSVNMLRLEIEQMRAALNTLAREETVLSVDRRWDDFDQRFNDFQDRVASDVRQRPADPELAALNQRLEQIGEAVGNLPESLSLRSLEEKVRMLAAALDHFIDQQGGRGNETFGLIEERLDEISRAIVGATIAAQKPHFDPEPFERIEARISALARQIEEVAEDRPSGEVVERINLLSERVDDIAAQSSIPDEAIERLARQIAVIADKIDRAPPIPDANEIFSGIEQRFDVLSGLLERRQGDALEQGNLLFRELERRLDEVADRIDRRQTDAALDSTSIMGAIDARFSALVQRLEAGKPDGAADAAIRGLEARLENISKQIDQSATQFAAIDPELVRNLESQVAGLSAHLARPTAPLPDFEDIAPRLQEIEKSIAGSRETVMEAARHAAENAALSLAGSQAESAAVTGLVQDLKALETLTRRSDERNSKTFEAIHDTLLKIVDRMGSLERETGAAIASPARALKMELKDAPSIDAEQTFPLGNSGGMDSTVSPPMPKTSVERSPAQAAAAAAVAALGADHAAEPEQGGRVRSMLGGLTRAFGGKKEEPLPPLAGSTAPEPAMDTAPSVDLDAPLDPKLANRPLEPGSGAPDLNAIMKRVRDERGQPVRHSETDAAKSDFIAAARRAAQAAAAEAEVQKRKSDVGRPVKALRIGDLLKSRRKPILMAAAAIMMGLAGLQLGKAFMDDPAETAGLDEAAPIAVEPQLDTASLGSTPPSDDAMAAMDEEILPQQPEENVRTVDTPDEQAMDSVPANPEAGNLTASAMPAEPMAPAPESGEPQPMDGVEIAAISPANEAAAAAGTPAETAGTSVEAKDIAIEIPADAGPLPLREAATAGDAKALFEVASRYAEGRGLASDMAQAAKWYEKSAELGFAPAQYRIGNLYEKGIGVTRDLAASRTWYQRAAETGNASAMHNLAVLYAMGADGQTNNDEAARWFVKAAELGVKDSQFNLGILAAKGVGMQQNLEESYKWFALVAKTGDKDAADKRDEIANSLRPEQLERARAMTELWKPKVLDPEANTVEIPDSWQENKDKTASIDMKKAVQNIQALLNKKGYDAGNPDGVMGGKTKTAIVAFQNDNDMEPTGQINEKLVRALLDRE